MDQISLFNIIITVGLSAMGWFSKAIWDAVQNLRQDLGALEVSISKEYVPKNDFKDGISEIKRMFEIISEKLDNKADK